METKGLDNFLKKLNKIKNGATSITSKIVDEISEQGAKILQNKYNTIDYDISNHETPNIFTEKVSNNNTKIIATSPDIMYIEFGTGTIGFESSTPELREKKVLLGLKDYNTGKTIRNDVPILVGVFNAGHNKYKKVKGWYKPTSALNEVELENYRNWVNGIEMDIPDGKRKRFALRRAYKYTHGTEGIKAGQQVFDTARDLEKIYKNISNEIIKEEISKW